MPHQLALTVKQPIIADPGWQRNCCNAVACWLWCVYNGHLTAGGQANPVAGGGFAKFLAGGDLPIKIARYSQLFLYKMAKSKGRRRWDWTQLSPRKGSLVLWVGKTVEHVSVNGGGNRFYGYNQNSHFSSCLHPANHYCDHPASDVQLSQGAHIYTVKASTALEYFSVHENQFPTWE